MLCVKDILKVVEGEIKQVQEKFLNDPPLDERRVHTPATAAVL
jgi:hypothetical protein